MIKYLKLFFYFLFCFFVFGVVVRVGSVFFLSGEVFLSVYGLKRNLEMSGVASFAITLAAFIFDVIDKRR